MLNKYTLLILVSLLTACSDDRGMGSIQPIHFEKAKEECAYHGGLNQIDSAGIYTETRYCGFKCWDKTGNLEISVGFICNDKTRYKVEWLEKGMVKIDDTGN